MLNATVGTWLNYATTMVFQVLFAARFGSTTTASSYALTFTIAIAASAVFIGTTQSVYIPRVLSPSGAVLSAAVRRVIWLLLLALVIFGAIAALASPIAAMVGAKLDRTDAHLVSLLRLSAAFGFSQVVVGQLAAISWARGFRFIPAVAPAVPSIVASVPLMADPRVTAQELYLLLTAGSLLQVIVLAACGGRRLRFSPQPMEGLGRLTLAFLGSYVVAQFMLPFEIFIAARSSASGGADFNYAYRALAVAQLLIVGGLTLSALPEWSDYVRVRARRALEGSVARTAALAALALSLAGALGVVAGRLLVRIAFQHGSFTAQDTRVVSTILVAALVGFAAEGMILVLSPALVADRRNRAAISIALARTTFVVLLVAILGLTGGPVGVALGYSAANTVVLAAEIAYLWRVGLLSPRESRLARSTALVTAGTVAAALLSLTIPVAAMARAALVCAVFAALAAAMRDDLAKPPTFRLSLRRRAEPAPSFQSDPVAVGPSAPEPASW